MFARESAGTQSSCGSAYEREEKSHALKLNFVQFADKSEEDLSTLKIWSFVKSYVTFDWGKVQITMQNDLIALPLNQEGNA